MSGGQSVDRTTRLFHDLHLAGDNAAEALEDIHAEFGTDFSGLDFSDYFPDETEAMGAHLALMLGFRSKKKALTVQNLIDAVGRGSWGTQPS